MPPWIAYLPPSARPDGTFLVSRVTNFADPRAPIAYCPISRRQVKDPLPQHFILTSEEFQAMARR